MKDILVIKCRAVIKPEKLNEFREMLIEQNAEGVVVIPPYFDALVVPEDIEIRVEEDDA